MTERPILTPVKPEWVDHYGHMNLAYYLVVFDMACDVQWLDLGFGPAYRARGMGTFAAESWQAYIREVREGAPLGSALGQKKSLPGLLPMFARLGEQTGQLPVMLQRAAQQLSSEVQRRAMALATVLEPLLIVAMGGVVMLIVLAVLLPIIELNAWVK
jgi:hypothetical protein